MKLVSARWIDLGLTPPEIFHRTYAALAECCAGDGEPVVLWGRSEAHVSIGQGQDPQAELAPVIGVPVVRRPLGGGAVWVHPSQHLFALVAPLSLLPVRPAHWFAWGLRPALQTFRGFGLEVESKDRDLWLDDRKIAGSGAATLGRCGVLGSSFLMEFPAERFAGCIACPSEGFRQWLVEGLRQAMTDWASHRAAPRQEDLAAAFRAQCEAVFGWSLRDCGLSIEEMAARDEPGIDEEDPWRGKGRLTPHGIKLNARMFLTERHENGRWARVLTRGGTLARVAVSAPVSPDTLEEVAACSPAAEAICRALERELPAAEACGWTDFILRTARFSDDHSHH